MKRSGPPERRTPLARSSLPGRRGRLRQTSPKRQAERDQRLITVAQVIARDGNDCRARTFGIPDVPGCWGPLDADEWNPRSAYPGGHLDPDNVQMLCRAHHDWKHAHPVEAARRGLRPYPAGYLQQPGDPPERPPVAR